MKETQKEIQEPEENNAYPSWHRRSQKAYKINRIIIILQIIAAFVMAGVVWFGVERVIH